MNKFLRCDTYKEANKKASKIFEKENINVYIFEFTDLNNPNYSYYYVTTNENIVTSRPAVFLLYLAINFKRYPNARAITIAIMAILLNADAKQKRERKSNTKYTMLFWGL